MSVKGPRILAAPWPSAANNYPRRGYIEMSMLDIARYLKINDALYDGRDRGRWLALPEKIGGLRPAKNMSAAKESRAVAARIFSGPAQRFLGGFLAD